MDFPAPAGSAGVVGVTREEASPVSVPALRSNARPTPWCRQDVVAPSAITLAAPTGVTLAAPTGVTLAALGAITLGGL